MKWKFHPMRLTEVEVRRSRDSVCLVGHAERLSSNAVPWAISEAHFAGSNGRKNEIRFEFPRAWDEFVSDAGDAFAIALLLPSMAANEPLELHVPVSESLLFNLTGIRDIFHTWYPRFHRVPIRGEMRRAAPETARSRGAATFFSGGIDSFYTLLKRIDHEPLPVPLRHMIFMHGIERSLEDGKGTEDSQLRAERIAAQLGVRCIVGTTNLRSLFPLHWEQYYFGSALAAVASTLARGLSYVCIPSAFTYLDQIPHGSSPLVDDRFSTPSIRIVHDGSEASRAMKTARIVDWAPDLVLENLRVCILNSGGDFNCGRCYKCVRTAVALEALGVRQRVRSFRDRSTGHWDRAMLGDHPAFIAGNLELARQRAADPALVARLERVVRKIHRYDGVAAYAKNSPLEHLLPIYRRARELAGGRPRMH